MQRIGIINILLWLNFVARLYLTCTLSSKHPLWGQRWGGKNRWPFLGFGLVIGVPRGSSPTLLSGSGGNYPDTVFTVREVSLLGCNHFVPGCKHVYFCWKDQLFRLGMYNFQYSQPQAGIRWTTVLSTSGSTPFLSAGGCCLCQTYQSLRICIQENRQSVNNSFI